MACKDCENGNPITPVYSNARYVLNPNCAEGCSPEIYVPPSGGVGSGKTTELIAGDDILIEDFSDVAVDRFRVSYDPFTALTATLSLQGLVGGIIQPSIILKGKIVDESRSSWTYNKGVVASQTLNEGSGAVAVPVLDRAKITTGLAITDDITYTLSGDDGQGESGSIAGDTASLLFGNYMITGDYPNMNNQPSSAIATLISGLANKIETIKRVRNHSVYGTGLTNRRFFIIYPESWGLGIFTKGIFEGGFVRLKNEGGTLTTGTPVAEVPITVTNAEGYTENYYVYQSLYDNTEDPTEPIIVS